MKTVLFHRDYRKFQGGHLKVWDYFNHVSRSETFKPLIFFSRNSVWDKSNPWLGMKDKVLRSKRFVRPDVLFVAGMDWAALGKKELTRPSVPVINFIQHVRHADPHLPLYSFLDNRAVRICVSNEVADAINATGRVNGPVYVIPNGINLDDFTDAGHYRGKYDILISALKNPGLGDKLANHFTNNNFTVKLLTTRIPRPEYIKELGKARAAIFLPNETEGFYLPALEGMAAGTIVVCPDCTGNRTFCLNGLNCFRPEYSYDSIVEAAGKALDLEDTKAGDLLSNAMKTAADHSLTGERAKFLDILENIFTIWT